MRGHASLASSSMALRSCKGKEELGWLLSPRAPHPVFTQCPRWHLGACDSPHQLPIVSDKDTLQLQQLEEVMCLQRAGTCGDKVQISLAWGPVVTCPSTPNLVQ